MSCGAKYRDVDSAPLRTNFPVLYRRILHIETATIV